MELWYADNREKQTHVRYINGGEWRNWRKVEENWRKMLIQEGMSLQEKLGILADAAKYDVSCSSSGSQRRGKAGMLGNTVSPGICHSFAADGRCISLLKILFTNQCIYDCRYCINRRSNDVVRTSFTPDEVCHLTMEFYLSLIHISEPTRL